jgi:hypothetical protein
MTERYQSRGKKSNSKFEVVGARQLAVRLPLPLVEVWEELQPEVEHLTGLAGLKIIRAVIEEEVTRRVGPRHRPDAATDCVRWGQQPGYVVFGGQKVPVTRPGCVHGKARRWNWTAMRDCNTTGGGNAR